MESTKATLIISYQLDPRQLIKLVVYGLLLLNFGYYFLEELAIARHTLYAGSTFLDWTSAFATSIDEFAWFALLFLFELETYLLETQLYSYQAIRSNQLF